MIFTSVYVLRLVFTGDGVGVGVVRALPTYVVKIENRSRKRSHKFHGIGVGRRRTVLFSSDSAYGFDAYDPVKTTLTKS